MASTGIENGTNFILIVNSVAVSHSTSFTLNVSMENRDATTKDSSGWRAILEGLRSWSIDGEMFFAEDATFGFTNLYALYTSRITATVMLSTEEAGDKYYQGEGYISSLSRTTPVEDSSSCSFTFEGTGVLTEGIGSP